MDPHNTTIEFVPRPKGLEFPQKSSQCSFHCNGSKNNDKSDEEFGNLLCDND
jgi:hypothetical protein